ncbi:MAG: dynamin family protein [Anaerolineales bacterium]|nr:dynamin family protein [Anaerolineales bacterium]
MHILTTQQEELLKEERTLLGELRVALVKFNATPEDQTTLKESLQQLDEFFLLVVVGEFNSGKSAFINALLGQDVLKEGVTPTTTQINILHYGETKQKDVVSEHLYVLTAPVKLLTEVSIVDTPGTNAIIREHELITSQFVPRADLVLFITSADRPFTESERLFLEQIRDWGKKVVVIINKIDILHSEEDLIQIRNFIAENALKLLGITPEIFPVSARQAARAKQGETQLWQTSRFEALETFIQETLDEEKRLHLKFLNPLGVGLRLVDRYLVLTRDRLVLLKDDFTMLEDVEQQLAIYKQDMLRDFKLRISDVENILYEVEQRGQDYFDKTIRIERIFDLFNKQRLQDEFERQVMSDVAQQIDTKVNELIDWIVESDLRQWQGISEHLAERRREHKERIVGDFSVGSFHYDRERLIEGVGREAQRVVETYDKHTEAEMLASGTRNAVAATTAIEIGAVGLGTLVATLATTAAMDVTGILLASVMAALGLLIIPTRRKQAKQILRDKMSAMRSQLVQALETHFSREIDRGLQHINEAISPYTLFVRAEGEKFNVAQVELDHLMAELKRLKAKVEQPD